MYEDRVEAGRALAIHLQHLARERPLVLALPRGGVPVGYEVARALGAPLDVVISRKLGVPLQPELAFGALGPAGERVLNEDVIALARVSPAEVERVTQRESKERARREDAYRAGRPALHLEGRTVILVDDGIATGATALAAVRGVKRLGPARLVLAVPVGPPETLARFEREVDEVVCPLRPEGFHAVGAWYRHFDQTSDEEVVESLRRAAEAAREGEAAPPPEEREVFVRAGNALLEGTLGIPEGARGIVLFAHGSWSSRFSPRNRWVARRLRDAGLATLILDLLTAREGEEDERTAALRFDIRLLAERVKGATEWVRSEGATEALAVGYFGSSTGAAAGLVAAAERPEGVRAIVSRGGRPDLADEALDHVRAATLLLVGGEDGPVIGMNEDALARLRCEKELRIVEDATHLFEEPGKLEEVADAAAGWFRTHLVPLPHSGPAPRANFPF